MRLQLIGANPSPQIQGLAELPGKSNYLLGNDPQKWHINVPSYARVKYQDVYPGIDLVYYGNQRQLEHDFIVAPGASPRAVTLGLNVKGAARIDARGDLVLSTGDGELRLYKPRVYQEVGGREQVVPALYALRSEHQVSFEVAAYDPAKPLVIDPVLSYSAFFGGGTDDVGFGMAVDSTGNAYVTGLASSTNFPTTAGVVQSANAGGFDAFVTKFNATGSSRVYSTYLGGTGDDAGFAIAVDSGGNAYVAGLTNSTNFPTSAGAFQAAFADINDAFVTKLNSTGTALAYSTYLGGTDDDQAFGIAVDSSGNALVYSTYLGGTGDDQGPGIAVDSGGAAYVTGNATTGFTTTAGASQTTFGGLDDAFVSKVVSNPDFSLAANPTTASVPAGQPATYNLTLTPKEGFNQAVSLSCTGALSLATCTVSPSQVTLNGSSNSTATVTVTTTAPGSTSRNQWGSLGAPPRGGSARASFLWLLLLAVCATLASLAAAKRRRAWLFSGAATLVFLMCLGCAATSTTPGSPPGNYTLTVTGTSGALSHNINVTLTVQ